MSWMILGSCEAVPIALPSWQNPLSIRPSTRSGMPASFNSDCMVKNLRRRHHDGLRVFIFCSHVRHQVPFNKQHPQQTHDYKGHGNPKHQNAFENRMLPKQCIPAQEHQKGNPHRTVQLWLLYILYHTIPHNRMRWENYSERRECNDQHIGE